MLIVMAGLPGTGKSTVARELAVHLQAVILNKDQVREAAFPGPVLDYSAAQDDLCMEFVYQAAAYILSKWPDRAVIVDGRTYSKRRQVERVIEVARGIGAVPQFIECKCDDETIRHRLSDSTHPAANRNWELYRELQSQADALEVPHWIVDTGKQSAVAAAEECVRYLAR